MITLRITLITLLLGLLTSCKPPNPPADYVSVVTSSTSTSGVVTLKATGFARKKDQAKMQAAKNAIEALLFDGVPGSSVQRPLINDPTARSKHSVYLERFFADGGTYSQFVQNANLEQRESASSGKYFFAVMYLDINYRALQKRLIQDGIIKKFGI